MKLRRISYLTPAIGLALLIGCGPDLEQLKNIDLGDIGID